MKSISDLSKLSKKPNVVEIAFKRIYNIKPWYELSRVLFLLRNDMRQKITRE